MSALHAVKKFPIEPFSTVQAPTMIGDLDRSIPRIEDGQFGERAIGASQAWRDVLKRAT